METSLLIRPWASRQDKRTLARKRQELGSRAFARGYQQNALSDSEKLFPHFKDCLIPGVDPKSLITREWMTVAGLDLAGSNRKGTCLIILAVSPDQYRTRVPVSVRFGAWNGKQIAEVLSNAIQIWHIRHTKIEDNSLQDTIIDLLSVINPQIEVSGFTTSANKRDPEIGLPSLDQEFERGLWRVADPHYADVSCNCDWCLWKRQMLNYPAVENADGVMSSWFVREAAVELGPGFGEVMDEDMPGFREKSPYVIDGASRFGSLRSRPYSWKLSTSKRRRSFR